MNYRPKVDCVDCDCTSSPFSELSLEELVLANKSRVEVHFSKGETIAKQGSLATQITFIKQGIVKSFMGDNSSKFVISLSSKGYFVGLQSIFEPNTFAFNVVAIDDVCACQIDISVFREFVSKSVKFSSKLLELINEETLIGYERMNCLAQKQLPGRFADLLLCLVTRIYRSMDFDLTLSRRDMAEVMNVSIESVSRIIRDFKDDEIIKLDGKKMSIIDMESIKRLSLMG